MKGWKEMRTKGLETKERDGRKESTRSMKCSGSKKVKGNLDEGSLVDGVGSVADYIARAVAAT